MAELLDQSQLAPDSDANAPPRIRLGEQGYPGLKTIQKQILEEANYKLRMPSLIREIDEMAKDSTVAAALNFYKTMLGRVKWSVKPKVGATPQQIERAKFIETCMHDMNNQSWYDFINSLLSCVSYGFSVHEKVYKRRTKNNSKYDDGLVGWAGLPARAQSTLHGWEFSEDGRNLTGFVQSLSNLYQAGRYSNLAKNGSTITIPREKFLLFRTNPQNENPEGSASLKSAWQHWRVKQEVEKVELIGLSRDLSGLFAVSLPARYMSPDASVAEKAVYEEYKRVVRNVANGEQQGVIIPSDCDDQTKQPMFKVELLAANGAKSYDTNSIVARLSSQILISLFADLLQLGNNATGSFALAGSKESIVTFALDMRLREIKNVLDNDLIKSTFQMNGWSLLDLPEFVYEPLDPISLDELGKFCQRVTSVGLVEIDRPILNVVRKAIGVDELPEDEEPREEYMNKPTSRASDGMSKGSGNGTSDDVAGQDNSVANNESV